jgi:hypothetical protein
LSRNEQGLLAPLVHKDDASPEYEKTRKIMEGFFKHLTGVVMFGNQSLEPMALGGADFDGDILATTDNSVFLNCRYGGVPVLYEHKKAEKDIVEK